MEQSMGLDATEFSGPPRAELEAEPGFGRTTARPHAEPRSRRVLVGLASSALFGLALGARAGGVDLVRHALGVPAGLAAVGLLGVPSLFVLLSLFDAPVSISEIADEGARAVASVGLLLSGIAPATALLVVTIQSPAVAAAIATLGLLLAGAIGGVPLLLGLFAKVNSARPGIRLKAALTLAGFGLFGVALAVRTWQSLLPILGGAS